MKDYFIVVPSMAIEKGLKGFELLIYCLINSYTSQGHVCYFGYKKLGELVGCSEKQARRCIDRLNSNRFIYYSDNGWLASKLCEKDKMSQEKDKMSQVTDKTSWYALLDELDKL